MDVNPRDRRVDAVFDEALVLYAQAGRREALERLASRWRPRHYAHARRLLGSIDAAADAVQDAWLDIVRGLWRLEEPSRFPAWSYAIVTRRCQDLLRRRRRRAEAPLDEAAEPAAPATNPGVEDVTAGLARLPSEQRAAVALYYLDGFTVAEIAVALAVPIGTVKTRLFHARRTLRRALTGENS
jgi:RNA polymerase sigma-70 factor (ECF subfamily)